MLKGKTAIITGGTRGIGYATAEKFLENGANVVIFGSKEETVNNALNKLKEKYDEKRIIGLWPNLFNMEEVKNAFEAINKKYGSIDILINNAGISAKDPIDKTSQEEFEKIMDLNVTSVFNCSKVAIEYMKNKRNGVILNTSSMVSIYGQPSGVGYPTSKFAVNGMTKSLAREVANYGIRVNAVAPGIIETDMMKDVPKEVIEPLIKTIPLGRIGSPTDIANAFLFLASDMASYISGVILSVDGLARS